MSRCTYHQCFEVLTKANTTIRNKYATTLNVAPMTETRYFTTSRKLSNHGMISFSFPTLSKGTGWFPEITIDNKESIVPSSIFLDHPVVIPIRK